MVNKRETALLICMPWSKAHADFPGRRHQKAQCFICQGFVAINPDNFTKGGVTHEYSPICGACAVDLIDADPEEHKFQLTDNQKADPRTKFIDALKGWPQAMVEHVRRFKADYDARPSAPQGGTN